MKSTYLLLSMALLLISIKSNAQNTTQSPPTTNYVDYNYNPLVEISRDKKTKKATFISNIDGDWELYIGSTPTQINLTTPVLSGHGKGNFPVNLKDNDKRYYFMIKENNKEIVFADKHLPIAGGFNFRDLGGYKTKDNHFVKWGKIFRSDDLSTLTQDDLAYLSSIPLLTVIDFRSSDEIKNSQDKKPSSLKEELQLSINPGNLNSMMDLSSSKIDSAMIEMNQLLVTEPNIIAEYRKMFQLLQNPENNVPLLYHCTAGKDRTGMASALILFALGMDEKDVMNDYLLSNKYIIPKFASIIQKKPETLSLFSVKKEFLQAGIDKMKEKYGSVDNFLINELNVDLAKLRNLYLD